MFLDAEKINFYEAWQKPKLENPYANFEFEEGDLKTTATLTYDFETDGWNGIIRVSETEESEFDEGTALTDTQIKVLKGKLTKAQLDMIEEFKAEYSEPKIGM
ncbi:hypothetical protein [Mesorhizobium sp. SP-1A]|uniref:hypothetical protein n=1 Tax=Mesorhizobium sp. SP-1A TaxID=3077840 RepID=UPI0028F6DF3A|nr:hypothetical protein [Mesorhizobium sp. SP-1A]